ncbi:hypothetical protein ACHAWF_013844 [Thalassiosira exigua]
MPTQIQIQAEEGDSAVAAAALATDADAKADWAADPVAKAKKLAAATATSTATSSASRKKSAPASPALALTQGEGAPLPPLESISDKLLQTGSSKNFYWDESPGWDRLTDAQRSAVRAGRAFLHPRYGFVTPVPVRVAITKPSAGAELGVDVTPAGGGAGVQVTHVVPGGLFAETRLKAGMTVESVDGKQFGSFAEGMSLMREALGRVELVASDVLRWHLGVDPTHDWDRYCRYCDEYLKERHMRGLEVPAGHFLTTWIRKQKANAHLLTDEQIESLQKLEVSVRSARNRAVQSRSSSERSQKKRSRLEAGETDNRTGEDKIDNETAAEVDQETNVVDGSCLAKDKEMLVRLRTSHNSAIGKVQKVSGASAEKNSAVRAPIPQDGRTSAPMEGSETTEAVEARSDVPEEPSKEVETLARAREDVQEESRHLKADIIARFLRGRSDVDAKKIGDAQSRDVATIVVTKPSRNAELGICIVRRNGRAGIMVDTVPPYSLFSGSNLRAGMTIEQVNGVKFRSYEEGVALMKEAEGQMTIVTSVEQDWNAYISMLSTYNRIHGNVDVPVNHVLFNWLKDQKANVHLLSRDQLELLKNLGVRRLTDQTPGPSPQEIADNAREERAKRRLARFGEVPNEPPKKRRRGKAELISCFSIGRNKRESAATATESQEDGAGERKDREESAAERKCFFGRAPLSLLDDKNFSSPLRCFLGHNICACAAIANGVVDSMAGIPACEVSAGQVGLGCIYCLEAPPEKRPPSGACFPLSLGEISQGVDFLRQSHFGECPSMPPEVRKHFATLQTGPGDPGTQQYWIDAGERIGLKDGPSGMYFCRDPGRPMSTSDGSKKEDKDSIDDSVEDSLFLSPEDKSLVPRFVYITMQQLQPCQVTLSDRQKPLKDISSIGVECRHCAGKFGSRKFVWNTAGVAKRNFDSVHSHMISCEYMPQKVKEDLKRSMACRKDQSLVAWSAKNSMFFSRVWARMCKYPAPTSRLNNAKGGRSSAKKCDREEVYGEMISC